MEVSGESMSVDFVYNSYELVWVGFDSDPIQRVKEHKHFCFDDFAGLRMCYRGDEVTLPFFLRI